MAPTPAHEQQRLREPPDVPWKEKFWMRHPEANRDRAHSSGTDHRISRNHLLKRGGLRNGQKLGNLVLNMTLGRMLTLGFELDC